MKAWLVRENSTEGCEVVFAETRGKAKAIALQTDTFSECDFCDLEVCRVAKIDKYYTNGKRRMDWDNQQDRLVLVKEYDFCCRYDEYIDRCQDCD